MARRDSYGYGSPPGPGKPVTLADPVVTDPALVREVRARAVQAMADRRQAEARRLREATIERQTREFEETIAKIVATQTAPSPSWPSGKAWLAEVGFVHFEQKDDEAITVWSKRLSDEAAKDKVAMTPGYIEDVIHKQNRKRKRKRKGK